MKEYREDLLDQHENNLGQVFRKYLNYWKLFALGVIICTVAVFLNLRYWAQTQYEIRSTILIKNTGTGQGIGDMDNFSNLGLIKTSQSLEDEIGILTSSGIMEEVISKNSFNITYYIKGNIRDVEIYGEDVPVKILIDETSDNLPYGLPINLRLLDSETYMLSTTYNDEELSSRHSFGDLVNLPYGTFTIVPKIESLNIDTTEPMFFVIKSNEEFVNKFLGNLNVVPANETGTLLSLSFISGNKKKGEDLLSRLIETYIAKTIKYENELAENIIRMIDGRLKVLSGEIEEVEETVVNFKTKNEITDVARNADKFIEQANDYKKRVNDYQTQINVLESIEQTLTLGDLESTIGGSFSISDPTLTSLINRYNEAFLQKQSLSQSAVTSNPLIVNLESNMTNIRASILQNIKSTKNGLIIARGNLLANASRYDAQIAKVPGMERKLLDISRDHSTKEGLYLYLLQKREEEILSLAAPVSSTRMVSLPKAGMYPISPNKKLFYFSGLLLGLFIPFSIIYVKEALNNKISSTEDLSKLISVPFLGEISRSNENSAILSHDGRQSSTVELFRLLRFNLDYLKKAEKNQTLLVTSTVKGEGKTFVASNLAVTLATNGEKVVVLSFDLRASQLMKNFDLPDGPGLTDFIIKNGMDIGHILQKHPGIENLHLIGAGAKVNQVGRLMLSKRIELLMETLKLQFDRIIIDTAPIGLISDAFALNSYIDGTIYVVRKDVSKKEYLKTIDAVQRNGKLKNTMILLNDTKELEPYGYVHVK
ncbi:capsular exopolysaccharide family [Arenibacter palladensis]|uniref:non-specific protein-tyrosine kinase n=1 Tax=Arenibacter palladensis TaxID=237373 RepID=A0A1M5HMK2_9FLAO|nr:polysaccharide biosynthesis tyrosine autokinase [Arenibacter palladensis]SHG17184.1 capsular exopolysaccharide family [Arenibacter palladensis]